MRAATVSIGTNEPLIVSLPLAISCSLLGLRYVTVGATTRYSSSSGRSTRSSGSARSAGGGDRQRHADRRRSSRGLVRRADLRVVPQPERVVERGREHAAYWRSYSLYPSPQSYVRASDVGGV